MEFIVDLKKDLLMHICMIIMHKHAHSKPVNKT